MKTISQIDASKRTYIGEAISSIVTGLPSGARTPPPSIIPKMM